MKARLACVLLPLLALCASAPAVAGPQDEMVDPPSFKAAVEVNVVNVDVRVTDAKGQPVKGLKKRDFELLEDDRRVEISNFAAFENGAAAEPAPPQPEAGVELTLDAPREEGWSLIVYVDNFDLHPGNRARALQQLRGTLARLLAPGDRVMLVSYDLGLKVQFPFTADPAAIDEALARMAGLATHAGEIDNRRRHAFREILAIQAASLADPAPLPCPLRIAQPAHDFAQARRDEVLRTLGALKLMVNSLSGVPGRKAVLHVSDGLPATPGEEVFQYLAELCGGGSGTGGIGKPQTVAPEVLEPGDPGYRPRVREEGITPLTLDPNAVYDARLLGPGAYQAASQAPIDAASYNVAK